MENAFFTEAKWRYTPVELFVEKWKTLWGAVDTEMWKRVWKMCKTFGSFRYNFVLCEAQLWAAILKKRKIFTLSPKKRTVLWGGFFIDAGP